MECTFWDNATCTVKKSTRNNMKIKKDFQENSFWSVSDKSSTEIGKTNIILLKQGRIRRGRYKQLTITTSWQ